MEDKTSTAVIVFWFWCPKPVCFMLGQLEDGGGAAGENLNFQPAAPLLAR